MDNITCVFEAEEFILCEDIAPMAASSNSNLKPTHFLHAIYLVICEVYSRILARKSISNWTNVICTILRKHHRALIMALLLIFKIRKACVARSQRVCAKLSSFRNDVQCCCIVPIKTKKAGAEIASGVNDTFTVTGP